LDYRRVKNLEEGSGFALIELVFLNDAAGTLETHWKASDTLSGIPV
jgi:hypothetical protein